MDKQLENELWGYESDSSDCEVYEYEFEQLVQEGGWEYGFEYLPPDDETPSKPDDETPSEPDDETPSEDREIIPGSDAIRKRRKKRHRIPTLPNAVMLLHLVAMFVSLLFGASRAVMSTLSPAVLWNFQGDLREGNVVVLPDDDVHEIARHAYYEGQPVVFSILRLYGTSPEQVRLMELLYDARVFLENASLIEADLRGKAVQRQLAYRRRLHEEDAGFRTVVMNVNHRAAIQQAFPLHCEGELCIRPPVLRLTLPERPREIRGGFDDSQGGEDGDSVADQ